MSKKLFCEEKTLCTDNENTGLSISNISSYDKSSSSSSRNVGLSLEIEINDSVKDILSAPNKNKSALLDVTVLKQKNFDSLYAIETSTLNSLEVRNLIASMDIDKYHKKKLVNKILEHKVSNDTLFKNLQKNLNSCKDKVHAKKRDKEPPRRKYKSTNTRVQDDSVVTDCSDSFNTSPLRECSIGDSIHQVYTSPRAYRDIRNIFECKNKHRYEDNSKPNMPCLCKNCAMVGVLQDSQKRPYMEAFNDCDMHCQKPKQEKSYSRRNNGRNPNWKPENYHLHCEFYFKYLSTKIEELEVRLAKQEEKAVPKDYFKRIVTKLVGHIGKLTSSGQEESPVKDAYQYSDKKYKHPPETYHHKYGVHSVHLNDMKPMKLDPKTNGHDHKSDLDFATTNANFWKWGEEILKPGVDLKNKIQSLLEESINNFKTELKHQKVINAKTKGGIIAKSLGESEMRAFVDTMSKKLYNAVNNTSKAYKDNVSFAPATSTDNRAKRCTDNLLKPKNTNSDSSIYIRRKMEARAQKKNVNPKGVRDSHIEKSTNVGLGKAYMWEDDSELSFKIDMSEPESNRCRSKKDNDLNEAYKLEFLKTLSNTKDVDKQQLWQSIWKQSIVNGQSMQDKVTIQIPRFKDKNNKTIEIHYTIAELENLLTKNKAPKSSKLEKLHKMMDRKYKNK